MLLFGSILIISSSVFSGSVIGPTFQFSVPKLKFGTISYGELLVYIFKKYDYPSRDDINNYYEHYNIYIYIYFCVGRLMFVFIINSFIHSIS